MERYEKYKDSGVEWIGEIPEDWKIKGLKYLLKPGNDGIKIGPFGSMLKSSQLSNCGFKVYGQENVIKNDFEIGFRYISKDKFEELSVYEISPEDLLITMMGTTGQAQLVPNNIERGIMDSHLIRVRAEKHQVTPKYLQILVNDSAYIFHQKKLQSKGSIMEGLNSSIIKSFLILLPPIPQQIAIANYLHRRTAEIDELIAQKELLIELYEEEKAAIINHAVTKGIDPNAKLKDSGVDWLGEVPEEWDIIALKRLVNKITDGEHISPKFTQTGMPFLSAKDVRDGYVQIPDDKFVDYDDGVRFRRRCDPEQNDILLVSRGATVGRVAVVDTDVEFCLLGSVILLKPKSKISSLYLFYSLKNRLVQDYFLYSSQSSAQQAIYLEKVASVYLAMPTIEEQIVIVDFIETEIACIDTKITKTKRIIELQKEYRTALISEVVTGKIKVTEESTP